MHSKKMVSLSIILAATAYSGVGFAAGEKTTVLKESDGRSTTVNTNEKGTTTTHGGKEVFTSGGDRHNDQVRDSMKNNGGTVIKDNTNGGKK